MVLEVVCVWPFEPSPLKMGRASCVLCCPPSVLEPQEETWTSCPSLFHSDRHWVFKSLKLTCMCKLKESRGLDGDSEVQGSVHVILLCTVPLVHSSYCSWFTAVQTMTHTVHGPVVHSSHCAWFMLCTVHGVHGSSWAVHTVHGSCCAWFLLCTVPVVHSSCCVRSLSSILRDERKSLNKGKVNQGLSLNFSDPV